MFRVVIPMCNVEEWIPNNIRCLQRQTCGDFSCVLLDDCSSDNTVGAARDAIGNDARFKVIVNSAKKFALGNLVQALDAEQPADEDIVVLVDADDCLAHDKVLERVRAIYESQNCWLTYGSYVGFPAGNSGKESGAYPGHVVRANGFRRSRWRGAHLRTFKAHLWRRIDPSALGTTDEEISALRMRSLLRLHLRSWRHLCGISAADILDPSGRYFRRCYDKAVMIPLLELAGERSHHIDEVLYHYHGSHNTGAYDATSKMAQRYTRCIRAIISARSSCQPVSAPG